MAVALGPLKESRLTQRGLGYSSVVRRLTSMCKDLESVPSATNKTMKRQLGKVAISPWLTLWRGEKHFSGEKGPCFTEDGSLWVFHRKEQGSHAFRVHPGLLDYEVHGFLSHQLYVTVWHNI